MTEGIRVPVRKGDCPCPGTPHEEEFVELEPLLSLPLASAALAAANVGEKTLAGMQAALIGAYLPGGIRAWSFVEGKPPLPVPITRENMERLIPWDRGGLEVSERADELYSPTLTAPLARRMQKASEPGPTEPSTSPSLPSGDATQPSSTPSSPAPLDERVPVWTPEPVD